MQPSYFSDRPADIDVLGRVQFATQLAQALLYVSEGDGLVVGIEGGWGSGKSTIIGFVKKALPECGEIGSQAIVVDFNPWMLSNTGAIVDALVTQIAASINLRSDIPEKAAKVGEKLLGYVSLLKYLKHLKYVPTLSFAGHMAGDLADAAGGIADGAKEARETLDDMKKLLPSLDLAKRKLDVVEALRELDRPIVVIVDDIDRLPADEIRTIVQAIKSVADFPRTTYLLAYDREVVADALGGGRSNVGLSYLEKIVQVVYPIPPLFEYQLKNFVDQRINNLLVARNIELREFEKNVYPKAITILTKLARHPRDVIRLMNRLMLSLPATRGEVNAIDVIIFEALSQRFPTIRENVHKHPTAFIGQIFRGDLDVEVDDADWSDWIITERKGEDGEPRWMKYMPESEPDRKIAARVCSFLFPNLSGKNDYVPEDELRMADPDRLARYFRMMSLESVPEATYVHKILLHPLLLTEALAIDDGGELAFLLEWICNYLPSCVDTNVMGSVKTIVKRVNVAENNSKLSLEIAELFAKVLIRLMRKVDGNERNDCFKFVIESSPLSVSEKIILEAAADQGKWYIRSTGKASEMQFISRESVVDEAIMKWSAKVRESIERDTLRGEPRMISILYRFAQLNFNFKEAYSAVEKICTTDEGLKAFISVHIENSPFDALDSYSLVADSRKLAERINISDFGQEYAWLVNKLSTAELADAIQEQSRKLMELNRPVNNIVP